MNLEPQARESAATERQHQKHRESSMDARAKHETQTPSQDGVSESAREGATSQRQHEGNRQANMQRRAHDEE
jgi:hypothetical protein